MVMVTVGVGVGITVGVGVRVKVRGGGPISTHTCMQGRIVRHVVENEGDQEPSRARASRKASSTHATCHKIQAAQVGIHHPCHMWISLSDPVMCVCPLNSQSQFR